MKRSLLVLSLVVPAAFPVNAETDRFAFTPGDISGDISAGSLSGKTKERVYDPGAGGRKVSQLDWKYNNAAIMKGSLEWNLMPALSVGASGWTTLAGRGSSMVDYDWMDETRASWTHRSQHPNTRLNYANEYDINLKGWLLKAPSYQLGVMAGYQQSRYSFKAAGGSYNYWDPETGQSESGNFPAGLVGIGYKQKFTMPYIGLTGSYRYQRFEFGATFKYSGWVSAADNDEHYLRDITFRSEAKNQQFYSLAVNAGYYVTPEAKVYLDGNWSRITNKRGNMSAYDHILEESGSADNNSGIENYHFITSVGLKYRF